MKINISEREFEGGENTGYWVLVTGNGGGLSLVTWWLRQGPGCRGAVVGSRSPRDIWGQLQWF